MAAVNLGRVGLVLHGDWSGAVTYAALDVVAYDGNSWVAKRSNTNVEPTTENNDDWQLISNNSTLVATVQGYKEDAEAAATTATTYGNAVVSAVAPIESTSTASQAYAAGDFFIYNGTLYIASASIAQGGTITPNTNCTAIPKGISSEVASLKSAFEQTQEQLINGYIDNSIYVSGATNRIGTILTNSKRCTTKTAYQLIAGDTISVSDIDSGLKCAIAGANNGEFIYDSGWLTTDGEYTVPTGKDGLYFVNIGKINEEDLSLSEITTLKVKIETFAYSSQIKELQKGISDLQNANNDFISPSINLANRDKFVENKYMTDAGAIGNNTAYYYTNKIPVSEGDVIYVTPSPRYKTAFNGDTVVSTAITFPWTVPSGIDGLIITGYMNAIDSLMVSKNKALPYIPYGDYINNDYLRIDNKNALNGNDGLTMEAQTLEALTTMVLSAYPKGLARHDRLTGYCEFSTIGEIEFGYGYTSNYFVKVDATNIYKYYKGSVVGNPVPHGLTITDYMAFAMIMDDDRVATVTINTTGGSASTTFNLNYSKNGLPFIRSTTPLSNVKLSAISADIKNPIWWFGDSYSSNADERIIGQLNNYNVIDKMLVNAVPGMRSYYDANTGAYNDFVKLISFAKPKYIIWTLGMNDTEANYKLYLLRVKNICDAFGITLYAAKIPSVPGIDNTGKAAYIDELGIRAIDWATAVNATAEGVWYNGYLSSDNVHPTVAGAQAMAARTIVDCPAIMQF